ncbi:MAG: HAD family phosphatase [Oscillospiraceae bacterium]|nr:HAD family phosphatase [Oscillospiraceae bacterium]
MIEINAAIFDMDGTLTDSMQVWRTVGSEFLKSQGVIPREDVDRRFCSMSVYDAVRFMKEEYGIEGSHDEVTDAINKTVEAKYKYEVPIKDGVFELLSELDSMDIPMCIATATEKYMADAALRRLGIRHFFKDIFTSRETGVGKEAPDIYLRGCALFGTEPHETAVFEDSFVAAGTAKRAGFIVAGLYDKSFEYKWDEVQRMADISAVTMCELLGQFCKKEIYKNTPGRFKQPVRRKFIYDIIFLSDVSVHK